MQEGKGKQAHRAPYKTPVIAKPVTDVTGVAIRIPVPMAPLPKKGGWHGEAVTGGFFLALRKT